MTKYDPDLQSPPASHRAVGGPEGAGTPSGDNSPEQRPPGSHPRRTGDASAGAASAQAAPRSTTSRDRGERSAWLLHVGKQLARHPEFSEYDPEALGSAYFALRMKGINPSGPGHVAPPGSLAHRWAYAHSSAKHRPGRPFEEALRRELRAAAADPPPQEIPVLAHDRRKNRHAPLLDADVPKLIEPLDPSAYRRTGKPGKPLDQGYDALVVMRELLERGYELPPGLLREGELEQLLAFTSGRTGAELEAQWNVKPATLRKRRERLRKRMVTTLELVKEGSVETPTIIERLARVEARVNEHDRQLGLVGDDEAANAVEDFLSDIRDEEGGTA